MPLVKGKSNAAFKANVGTLMGEVGKSPHVQSRAQALAIAFSKKRTGKKYGGAIRGMQGEERNRGGAAMNPWMAGRYASGGDVEPLPIMPESVHTSIMPSAGSRSGSGKGGHRPAADTGYDIQQRAKGIFRPRPFGEKLAYGGMVPLAAGGEVVSDEETYPISSFEQYAMERPKNLIEGRPRGTEPGGGISGGEKISSAAVRLNDGRVFEGPTHGEAFSKAARTLGIPEQVVFDRYLRGPNASDSGFITTNGRYVTRGEAGKIASEAKQFRYSGGTKAENMQMAPRRAYGGMVPLAAGGAAISHRVDTAPWYQRNAMRRAPRSGMLGGASPGRVDNLPIHVKSGSYVVPADIVSAIGQGNSQAGAKMMSKMFSGSKMNKYGGGNFRMKGVSGLQRGQFQEGGMVPEVGPGEADIGRTAGVLGEQDPVISAMGKYAKAKNNVPIIAASGEFIIDPDEVRAFGDGDAERGFNALDKWVLGWRKRHIKTLQKLKPPKAD